MLKIYTSPTSPFGARVTIAARVKKIELQDLGIPAEGLKSPEFRRINPVSKAPVLILEDGTAIPESETIINYIEDRFPRPALRPEEPEGRARMNTLIRIMDNYVMAPVIRLFPQLDPATRDAAVVSAEVSRWQDGLGALSHYMREPLPTAEAGLTLADCALPPALRLSRIIAGMLGLGDLLAPHPALTAYQARICAHPIVGKVLDEMDAALAAR